MAAIFGRSKKVDNQVVAPRTGETDVGLRAAGDASHSVEPFCGLPVGKPGCLNLGALMPY